MRPLFAGDSDTEGDDVEYVSETSADASSEGAGAKGHTPVGAKRSANAALPELRFHHESTPGAPSLLCDLSLLVTSGGFLRTFRGRKPCKITNFATTLMEAGWGDAGAALLASAVSADDDDHDQTDGEEDDSQQQEQQQDGMVACLFARDNLHFFGAGGFCDTRRLAFDDVVAGALVNDDQEKMYCRLRPMPRLLWSQLNRTGGGGDGRAGHGASGVLDASAGIGACGAARRGPGTVAFKDHLCACWVGSRGTITPLHFDLCHGLLLGLVGVKKVTLFAPKDTMYLYRNNGVHPNPNASAITWDEWKEYDGINGDEDGGAGGDGEDDHGHGGKDDDHANAATAAAAATATAAQRKRFPNVSEATPIEVVLSAGELLYIPPGWWHHVEGMTPTVAVLLPFDMEVGESLHPSLAA